MAKNKNKQPNTLSHQEKQMDEEYAELGRKDQNQIIIRAPVFSVIDKIRTNSLMYNLFS